MSTSTTPHADKLRAEIAAAGAAISGGMAETYLASTDAKQVVADLRRGGGNGTCSPAVRLLLALGDETLALTIAALKGEGSTGEAAEGGEAQAQLADALAESYLTNHRLRVLLDAGMDQIGRLLKRVERAGTVLESDAGARDALALRGTYNLFRDEPDNLHVLRLIDELAERAPGQAAGATASAEAAGVSGGTPAAPPE